MSNILIYDLECSGLKVDFSTTLCIGYKWLGEEGQVISLTDFKGWKKEPWNDKRLWETFMKVYNQADMVITYYGKGFDQPYMYAKLLKHELPIPPNLPHVDLFFTVKSNTTLSRKSLANVSYYLGLEATKTPVEGQIWVKAGMGDEASINYIKSHCLADLDLTEELYNRLRPLIRTHPRVSGYGPCRACGSTRLQRRGKAITTLKFPKQRVQCQSCGSWDQRDIGEYLPGEGANEEGRQGASH